MQENKGILRKVADWVVTCRFVCKYRESLDLKPFYVVGRIILNGNMSIFLEKNWQNKSQERRNGVKL